MSTAAVTSVLRQHISRARRACGLALTAATLTLVTACDALSKPSEAPPPAPRQMDGIEIRAAGKTASESAREALAERDLNTLRMVLTYVMHRAPTPLLPSTDVALIELGIHCLEAGPKAADAAHALLDRTPPGKLALATRKACLGD